MVEARPDQPARHEPNGDFVPTKKLKVILGCRYYEDTRSIGGVLAKFSDLEAVDDDVRNAYIGFSQQGA